MGQSSRRCQLSDGLLGMPKASRRFKVKAHPETFRVTPRVLAQPDATRDNPTFSTFLFSQFRPRYSDLCPFGGILVSVYSQWSGG